MTFDENSKNLMRRSSFYRFSMPSHIALCRLSIFRAALENIVVNQSALHVHRSAQNSFELNQVLRTPKSGLPKTGCIDHSMQNFSFYRWPISIGAFVHYFFGDCSEKTKQKPAYNRQSIDVMDRACNEDW